jgi:hypothetical protein
LAVDLKGRTGYDFSLPIGQINDEIGVIEAGLDRLNAAHSTGREGTWDSSSRSSYPDNGDLPEAGQCVRVNVSRALTMGERGNSSLTNED